MTFSTRGIPPPLPTDRETPPGATLSEDEIIEKLENGDIKISDMSFSEREKYRHYAKNRLEG